LANWAPGIEEGDFHPMLVGPSFPDAVPRSRHPAEDFSPFPSHGPSGRITQGFE